LRIRLQIVRAADDLTGLRELSFGWCATNDDASIRQTRVHLAAFACRRHVPSDNLRLNSAEIRLDARKNTVLPTQDEAITRAGRR
jgi:hypothetical protein